VNLLPGVNATVDFNEELLENFSLEVKAPLGLNRFVAEALGDTDRVGGL
jgi:hypothetical protein